MVDEGLVARLSQLANVDVEPAELTSLAADLTRIVAYMEILRDAELDDVPPLPRTAHGTARARPDQPEPSLDREAVFAQAPKADASGFIVPAFVDEG